MASTSGVGVLYSERMLAKARLSLCFETALADGSLIVQPVLGTGIAKDLNRMA